MSDARGNEKIINLPEPRHQSEISVEETLLKRRSIRSYKDQPLELAEVSQLLWSAQGITDPYGFRTAPSAGALYPLEVYLVAGKVKDLDSGIYKYIPERHKLRQTGKGDKRAELCRAALGQSCVRTAPVSIVFAAVYERTTSKYGERGIRYVHMEAGHAAENVYLQAVSLKLGTVVIGAFYDSKVKQVVGLENAEEPLYIMPVGRRE